MTNRNSKVDYSGRTVDLLLLKTVLEIPAANHKVGIDVGGTPMIVSGVEKMVQRFALAFLNAIQSTKFRADHGSTLVPKAAQGLVYNLPTLEAAAAESNLMARTQMQFGDAGEDTPDDERLIDSVIDSLEFDRARATAKVSVTLVNAAGGSYKYIIPVPVGVRS